MNKVYADAKSALAGLLKDGMTIMAGGFGLCGIPESLILAIRDSGVKNLTVVSNNAGVAGIPAFFTKTGVGTQIAEGKDLREFDGQRYVMERGIVADLAIVHAYKGDTEGNLVYRKTARNFNPVMATAGKVTVAEVEQLVKPGDINPDHIITPGIFVQRIIHVPNGAKYIEQRTVRKRSKADAPAGTGGDV